MRTKLSLFCDKVIEAGWLAAVIIVPLFFNIYSQRVFEPDKLSLLRSIALVMSAAWIIRALEDWRFGQAQERVAAESPSFWRRVYSTPMVLPTLLLVVVYLISTAMSLVPRTSLMGSYQRMQGTYTTLSYIVIFFLLLGGLRTKRQFNRLITVMILVSFPIAMYGLVQHFGLDPLPWGGDVKRRVASNMGNAIFVAAFLIMVVPLTLSRLLENWRVIAGDQNKANATLAIVLPLIFALLVGFSWILELPFPPVKESYFWMGLLASLIYLVAMVAFAYYLRRPVSRLLLLAAYSVIFIAQIACIFYTQSRGPLLGLLGGLFFYFAVLGLIKRQIWLPWVMSALAVVVIVFLAMFNTVESPLMDTLREMPYVGRLGQVLQTETGTGKVRLLIWEGVVNMIDWHAPLEWPGEDAGQDTLNAVRPIIGYGPESMYVAYNRFYPPDLAHYEKRNASPDRSHNETFDALVITGGLGFAIYVLVFASVFYYGLKWLNLIRSRWQTWVFIGLWIGGGVAGALITWVWLGVQYVGVGIPLGVIIGVAIYLFVTLLAMTFQAVTSRRGMLEMPQLPDLGGRYALWTLALLSAVVAHFVEIHFGIAIAATRTYFWVSTAMMVAIGFRLALQPLEAEPEMTQDDVSEGDAVPTSPRRRRRSAPAASRPRSRVVLERQWQGSLMFLSIVTILILSTLLFDYVTVQQGDPGVLLTLWRSLTQSRGDPSLVMLVMLLVTWGMIGLVGFSDLATRQESKGKAAGAWLGAVGIFVAVSFFGALFFGLLHAVRLRPLTINQLDVRNPLTNTITFYYVFVFLIIAFLALVLGFLIRRQSSFRRWDWELGDIGMAVLAVILPVIAAFLIYRTNVSIVRADILYKQGLSSEKAQNWDGAIYFYKQAVEMAKNEDFYYLFLGRAYMEKGRTSSGQDRELALEASRDNLQTAREKAPLNTDHSANLARLHRTWGGLSKGEERTDFLNQALLYYADATSLSPHNAQLFNEWGQTYYALNDHEKAMEKYQQSLSLDQEYEQTYLLLGEFYMRDGEWDKSLEAYLRAAEVKPKSVEAFSALGYVYTQMGDLEAALESYQKAIELKPRNFNSHKNLALLYAEMGRPEDALREATEALNLAPDSEKPALQAYIAQLGGTAAPEISPEDAQAIQDLIAEGSAQMKAEQWDAAEATFGAVLELNPNHPQARSALAYVYARQGRIDEAISENLAVVKLVPNDYNSYKNLGLLYQQKGQIQEAILAIETALTLAPESETASLQMFLAQLEASQQELSPEIEPGQRAGDLSPQARDQMYSAPPPMIIDPSKSYQATIVTDKGSVVIDLATADAPQTVNNFIYLSQEGYYDGLVFHRVENSPGFSLIQGGDPTGTGRGGPGYTVPAEIGLPHDAGAIATARTGDQINPERASSGSQFYICLGPIHQLDGAYTVFGYVVEGLDVAQGIAVGDKIRSITISEK